MAIGRFYVLAIFVQLLFANQIGGQILDLLTVNLTKPYLLSPEQVQLFLSNHIPVTQDAEFGGNELEEEYDDSSSQDNERTIESCFCGQSNQNRIIGGTETSINEYPWMAYLIIRKNNSSFLCGGYLVTDRHIITAAHCTLDAEASGIVAILGDHNRSSSIEVRSLRVNVQKISMHPNYNQPERNNNDISVLTLEHCLEFNRKILPICLPAQIMDYTDRTGVAVGWGTTNQGGRTSDVLRAADVPIISQTVCEENYAKAGVTITKKMICAGRCGKDSCQGDSGGPLQILMGGRFYAIGVVSFGIGCGIEEYPGVFTRVDRVLRFIQASTRGARMCI